ncbi:6-bladed beta-propeller, partial [candidate division KSB1 bacterium]
MKFLVILFLCLFPLSFCGKNIEKSNTQQKETSVPELIFGDKDLPEEYLLAFPQGLAVDNKGDIYVADENSVKVFSENGKPKIIIGRKGQGPGEFEGWFKGIYISPYNYLTVISEMKVNVFDPDHEFVAMHNIGFDMMNAFQVSTGMEELHFTDLNTLIAINDNEIVMSGIAGVNEPAASAEKIVDCVALMKNNACIPIIKSDNISFFAYTRGRGGGFSLIQNLGRLHFGLLPGNKIVYTHSSYDFTVNGNIAEYYLTIVDLEGNVIKKLSRQYEPEKIEKSHYGNLRSFLSGWSGGLNDPKIQSDLKEFMEYGVEQVRYYPYVGDIITDGNFIFVYPLHRMFLNEHREIPELDKIEADVFNADTGEYLGMKTLPISPMVIKNGYTYTMRMREGFMVVEKYKLDPSVYK